MPFTINTESVARMTAMIRLKQLAQKSAQDRLIDNIKTALETTDTSGETLTAKINSKLEEYHAKSVEIQKEIATFNLEDIGFPILRSKTHVQLNMVKNWGAERGEDLLHDLTTGKLYHSLPNDISRDELPVLQSPSETSFWGNENASVSSAMLASIAYILAPRVELNLTGAATFYPFLNQHFETTLEGTNPFYFNRGFKLFGDYQFGAHRYFSSPYPGLGQQVFAPEDCSSAVAKATSLTEEQVAQIYTGAIKAAYSNPTNEYHYAAVLDGVQEGDIYLRAGHTAIISEVTGPEIDTLGFNRDIDCAVGKQLGGGSYKYNLHDSTEEKPILILRSSQESLGESSSLADFLSRIDGEYFREFGAAGPMEDITGDCYNILDNID